MPTLLDLLELTALIAQKDPRRHGRVAARWLAASADANLDDVHLAAAALQALGGRDHAGALALLRDMAERASGRRGPRGVA